MNKGDEFEITLKVRCTWDSKTGGRAVFHYPGTDFMDENDPSKELGSVNPTLDGGLQIRIVDGNAINIYQITPSRIWDAVVGHLNSSQP
jgi:hypothetical protein